MMSEPPGKQFSLIPPSVDRGDFSVVMKPGRPVWLIVILIAILAAFSIPYFSMGLLGGEDGMEDLFDLVSFLFQLMWIGGWSMGVLAIVAILLVVMFGQERLIIRPGVLTIRYEVLSAGLSVFFPGDRITNLRFQLPEQDSPNSMRKGHLVMDYAGRDMHFGWNVRESDAADLIEQITARAINLQSPEPLPTSSKLSSDTDDAPSPDIPAEPNRISAIALIVANLVPLIGVLFMDWRVGDVMLVYWAESAVIGIFNVAKMAVIGGWSALFFGPFFFFHYGGFMVGHLLFIYGFMVSGPDEPGAKLIDVFADFYLLLPALLALFVSHGVSFYLNFLGKKEYVGRTIKDQMSEPYRRIILMHVTIIFGGFFVMALGDPLAALILMIILKVAADLRAHRREHEPTTELIED